MVNFESTSLTNLDNVPLSISDNVNSTACNCLPAVSSVNVDALNVSSVPQVAITSSLSVSCPSTVVEVNPVTTHSQLHFVSEEIQTQASSRSRISPVLRHVRMQNTYVEERILFLQI
jgi:hypothetical protein